MTDLEQSLSKAFHNPAKTLDVEERIYEELENAVSQTSVRTVVKKLAIICHDLHSHQPYFNFDKDAVFLEAIAHKIEN